MLIEELEFSSLAGLTKNTIIYYTLTVMTNGEKLNEKELAEKMSSLIRGMSAFKLYQILGIMKEIVSDHISIPGNSVSFQNLFKISNKEIGKYSINEKKTLVRNQLKVTFSETIKNKLNE